MSAYAEICSMFEQRRKVEEEYASAAYSQLLTFVELFEFYIGCQQPDLVVPLRIDECCNPLPDQTAPFRIVDNKMIAAVCIRTEDKNDCTWVPVSVKPISLVECFMEIGYGTDRVKQFHVNFSYGAIGIKQTSSDNALSYLEAMFKEEATFNPFHTKDDTNGASRGRPCPSETPCQNKPKRKYSLRNRRCRPPASSSNSTPVSRTSSRWPSERVFPVATTPPAGPSPANGTVSFTPPWYTA